MSIDSPHLVKPGKKFALSRINPDDSSGFKSKDEGVKATEQLLDRMTSLQARLYAESKRSLLIVLQAMDTGGKDGAIKVVFGSVNPQGCTIANFKAPSSLELSHDYLWRIHSQCPARGMIGIFNRSHYEDVLVPVVKKWILPEHAKRRYDHINAFERMLVDEGTTIVKFMLHISKDEQRERLIARQEDPEKHWKFNPGDLEARKDWDAYQRAYEAMINACSTAHAPWYVVPANRKWHRNYVMADAIVRTLEALDPQYPRAEADPRAFTIE